MVLFVLVLEEDIGMWPIQEVFYRLASRCAWTEHMQRLLDLLEISRFPAFLNCCFGWTV